MASQSTKKSALYEIHSQESDEEQEQRVMYISAPGPPTTRIPSFAPTPTKIPVTENPTFHPSRSSPPSLMPTSSPSWKPTHVRVPPKVEVDEDTKEIATATCEDSFVEDLDEFIPNVHIPPLEDMVVEYDYEAFILDTAVKEEALKEVEYEMFRAMLGTSPWMVDEKPLETDCSDMLADLLDQRGTSRNLIESLNWGNYLGWKNYPPDRFKEGAECVNSMNLTVANATCYPITGIVTAQVPFDLEIPSFSLKEQIVTHVKTGVENDHFQTESIPEITFIGVSGPIDFGEDINRDNVLNPDRPADVIPKDNKLSAFGISAIVLISVSLTILLSIAWTKFRRRCSTSKERELDKIQDDAIALGSLSEHAPSSPGTPEVKLNPHDLVQVSPDSVEVVDTGVTSPFCCGTGGATGYGVGRDSLLSVQTEDFVDVNEKAALFGDEKA